MAKLREEYTTDFSQGMFDSVAQTAYPPASVAQLLNARIEADGTARRRPGSIRTHSAQNEDGTCFGATRFTLANNTDLLIVIFGTKAYKSSDYGANWTQIATGLRQDYYTFATWFVGGTNYLFLANGDTTIKQYDGTTWTTVSNAPSGVKYISVFNQRLWAAGHNGNIVQASRIGDKDTWASPYGLTVQVQSHGGDALTGMYQVGPHLLVFDRHATSYIDGFGEQTLIVASGATGFSRSVGCSAFRTIVGIGDNGCAWLSDRGVEYYIPGQNISLVSRPVDVFLSGLDWAQLYDNPGRPSACYDEVNQDYHLAIALSGQRNDRVLVINLLQQNVEFQRQGQMGAASIDRYTSPEGGGILFTGGTDGYLTDTGGLLEADVTAQGYWQLVSSGGDNIGQDANGYLSTATNDALPATMFVGPYTDSPSVVYWGGYDGWVRRAYSVDSDDMDSDETGGLSVTMTIVTRPYLFRNARTMKRIRAIHIQSLQDDDATATVRVRGQQTQGPPQSVSLSASALSQSTYAKTRVKYDGRAPQVEFNTSDDIRVSLLGVSAEVLREPI